MTDRLTILTNANVSRGKAAAAAVHAALAHYGIDHGAVIVLGASPSDITERCSSVIHDAGRTEVDLGTVTAGVLADERDGLSMQARGELARLQAAQRAAAPMPDTAVVAQRLTGTARVSGAS